jgi:HEPN domain-containing protein
MSGVNRNDLQFLASTRLAEAKILLGAGRSDGAYYLAGYAVECTLKACIARGTQRHEFPDKKTVDASHTHNLRDLIKVANLEFERLEEAKRDPLFPALRENLTARPSFMPPSPPAAPRETDVWSPPPAWPSGRDAVSVRLG